MAEPERQDSGFGSAFGCSLMILAFFGGIALVGWVGQMGGRCG